MPCPSTLLRPAGELTQPVPKRPLATRTVESAKDQENDKTTIRSSTTLSRATIVSSVTSSLRKPVNKERSKRSQREIFLHQLRDWASHHDSSVYFNGSISLHPQGACPGEVLALGKSVNCILNSPSSERSQKKIVIRLFESRWHCSHSEQKEIRSSTEHSIRQSVAPYLLVVRSGSGWVQAREYFDKHHFTHYANEKRDRISCFQNSLVINTLASAQRNARTGPVINSRNWRTATQPPTALANLVANTQISPLVANIANSIASNLNLVSVHPSAWASLPPNNLAVNHISRTAIVSNSPTKRIETKASLSARERHTLSSPHKTDTVMISPSFRPFLRLPQELQDEILFQAIGYRRIVSFTRAAHLKYSTQSSRAPITISKLFRISKSINRHMVPHIYRSTNFHFGATGFTKFLWQLGPTNRSDLQHLTFHFGNASLLHCIRWLAPDPIWELFEPPVATNPPTLTQFWRCQIQDLMKELSLSTMTIDIKGVPAGDVPMLVRILKAAIGSIERIRVVDEHSETHILTGEYAQALQQLSGYKQEPTWREMCLQYHRDYKHQRWHMRSVWTPHGKAVQKLMKAWMDTNKAFFDS